jgi:hypothetical protein
MARNAACGSDSIAGQPTLARIARAYIANHRPRAQAEADFYAGLPSLREAVRRASRAERPDGKRHDHQTRIRRSALRVAGRRLKTLDFRRVKDFGELHALLSEAIGTLPGIGELMVYDTSLRIGARLGLEPELVYLHAGTRRGARALGLESAAPCLRVSELPAPLRRLRPREIEDALCIYKRHFGRVKDGRGRRVRSTLRVRAAVIAVALAALVAPLGASAQTLCPDGSYVGRGPCQLCPDGRYVGGGTGCELTPDGTYVPARRGGPKLAPDGSYVPGGDGVILCPDGSYVSGSRCVLAPDGSYVGE